MSDNNVYSEKEKEFDDRFGFILYYGIDSLEGYNEIKNFYCQDQTLSLIHQSSSEST